MGRPAPLAQSAEHIHGKDGVASSILAGGSTHRLTSGNAGQLFFPGVSWTGALIVLAFGIGCRGACQMENASLVSRFWSLSGRPGAPGRLVGAAPALGMKPGPLWPLERLLLDGLVRPGGRRGRPARGDAGRATRAGGASGRSG